jgi:hypothetical protein
MNIDEWIQRVLKFFPADTVKELYDLGAFPSSLITLFNRGFTVLDAKEYINCMEEFNPDLNEDTALIHMTAIYDRVEKRKQNAPNNS